MPFEKGDKNINRNGRPKGTKNFSTLVDETIKEIADEEGITQQQAWRVLIKRAYKESKGGNVQFYKDLMDRYYGKPKEKVEVEAGDDIKDLLLKVNNILQDEKD